MKAFRNLISGEDEELATAYKTFHKMIDQERAAIGKATLLSVQQINNDTVAMRTDIGAALAATQRVEGQTESLMASTGQARNALESRS